MSLGDDLGTGGHLKTRLGPFADELTSRSDRRVSAISCDRRKDSHCFGAPGALNYWLDTMQNSYYLAYCQGLKRIDWVVFL